MQQVLIQTKLEKEVCAQVWGLVNPQGEEIFSKAMFLVAMHLLFKKKKDPSLILPKSIPASLADSAGLQPVNPSRPNAFNITAP